MSRLLLLSLAAVCCTGCQGCQTPRQAVDPFLGRTTVPPPPTGIIGPAGSVAPDSGGFLQQAPATGPATNNQFAPPDARQDLYAPPGINASPPVGGYPGYQSSTTPPAGNRLTSNRRPTPTAAPGSAAVSIPVAPATPEESGVRLASATQPWTAPGSGAPSATSPPASAASTGAPLAAAPTSYSPAGTTSQIRIVQPPAGGGASTDIMNLPPKGSAWSASGDRMQ